VLARKRRPGRPAFSDRSECLQYSCSLLLRRVDASAPLTTQVGWFSAPNAKSPLPTDIVTNLLEGYEYYVSRPGTRNLPVSRFEFVSGKTMVTFAKFGGTA
jgi:hypothetical protein